MQRSTWVVASLYASAIAAAVVGQDYTVDWHTVDCGGGFAAGGAFELDGTIGQPDASSFATPMTGGSFELVGGFWVVGAPGACACPGDVTGDGARNGGDIGAFVGCLLGAGGSCTCADMDGNGTLNFADVGPFVGVLRSGAACP